MKLFVGNLSYDTTEAEVREFFANFEPIIDFHRPNDRETGQPRGFAFVTLTDRETGEKAIEELNDKELGGRQLRINEAEERRNRGPQGGQGHFRQENRGGGDRPRNPVMDDDAVSAAAVRGSSHRIDDRPIGKDGKKVRYKGI